MASVLNGMATYGGVIPYGGTFLIFSDYLRPALRLAALSKVKPILIFTHDSIGLGEDGPTHQPIEHLSALRAIPGLVVIRPSDANETTYAWQAALEYKEGPVALALTRQNLPVIDQKKFPFAKGLLRGAYIIKESSGEIDMILIASGSEVYLAVKAAEELESTGIRVRVVSFPSWELFELQDEDYKKMIFPDAIAARVSIEAGVAHGWEKYVGPFGASVSIETFGHSAPGKIVMEKSGFNVPHIVETAQVVLRNFKK
jgi:transketolase